MLPGLSVEADFGATNGKWPVVDLLHNVAKLSKRRMRGNGKQPEIECSGPGSKSTVSPIFLLASWPGILILDG